MYCLLLYWTVKFIFQHIHKLYILLLRLTVLSVDIITCGLNISVCWSYSIIPYVHTILYVRSICMWWILVHSTHSELTCKQKTVETCEINRTQKYIGQFVRRLLGTHKNCGIGISSKCGQCNEKNSCSGNMEYLFFWKCISGCLFKIVTIG